MVNIEFEPNRLNESSSFLKSHEKIKVALAYSLNITKGLHAEPTTAAVLFKHILWTSINLFLIIMRQPPPVSLWRTPTGAPITPLAQNETL